MDAPADPRSSYRAIENLIGTYAELVDDGDFAGLGSLLADATFTGNGGSVRGPDAIEQMFRDMLIVYDDGTPRTKHVTTNVIIDVDEEAGAATSRAYFTVLQALPGLPCSPSSAAGTGIASIATTGSGASRNGTFASISPVT